MSWICSTFGHKMPKWNDYHKLVGINVDGINRLHGYLHCECKRCGKIVSSGMVHLPNTPVGEGQEKKVITGQNL